MLKQFVQPGATAVSADVALSAAKLYTLIRGSTPRSRQPLTAQNIAEIGCSVNEMKASVELSGVSMCWIIELRPFLCPRGWEAPCSDSFNARYSRVGQSEQNRRPPC